MTYVASMFFLYRIPDDEEIGATIPEYQLLPVYGAHHPICPIH